jgi:hypothetical protein
VEIRYFRKTVSAVDYVSNSNISKYKMIRNDEEFRIQIICISLLQVIDILSSGLVSNINNSISGRMLPNRIHWIPNI